MAHIHDWREHFPEGLRQRYFEFLISALDSVQIPTSCNFVIADTIERELHRNSVSKLEYETGIFDILGKLTRTTSQYMQLVVHRVYLNITLTNHVPAINPAPSNVTLVNTARSVGQGSSFDSSRFGRQFSGMRRPSTSSVGQGSSTGEAYNQLLRRPSTSSAGLGSSSGEAYNQLLRTQSTSSVGQGSSSGEADNQLLRRPLTSTNGFSVDPPPQEPSPLISHDIAQIASRLASSAIYMASSGDHHRNHQEFLACEPQETGGGRRDGTAHRIYQIRLQFLYSLCMMYRKYDEALGKRLAEAERIELTRIKSILNGVLVSLLNHAEIRQFSGETLDNYESDIRAIVLKL